MNARFAAAVAAAAEQAPMSSGTVHIVPGRVLLADGDGLAYYCAGNDDTDPGQARMNLISKLDGAMRACGAESVNILTTARGSHKGHRYAVARIKPYQGHRGDARRPNNWEYLRGLLEEGFIGSHAVELTVNAEADDLFSKYTAINPDCVIYTQDKDMRMTPGWHLDWLTHIMFRLEPGTWAKVSNDKLYGRKWFWMQMLHGDTADYVPGLPFHKDGSLVGSGPNKGKVKEIRCGEAEAEKLLAGVESDMGATLQLQKLYRSCYGERWLVEMLEQGILLWMRNDLNSSPFNVTFAGNPLAALRTHEDYQLARAEIMARITGALIHEETQSIGSSGDSDEPAVSAGEPVQALPTAVLRGPSGPGPQPLDGLDTCHPSSGVQFGAWKNREQPSQVRRAQPFGLPERGGSLLTGQRDGQARLAAPISQDA